jgi:hypothetical protein
MVGDDWANCVVIAVQSPVELSYFSAVGKNLAVALCTRDTLTAQPQRMAEMKRHALARDR